LGDVAGQIAHSFQIGIDHEDRCDPSQVARDRLVQGEDFQAFLEHFVFELVDVRIARDDRLRGFGVAILQRTERFIDRFLDHPCLGEDHSLQIFEIACEMLGHETTVLVRKSDVA